MAPIFLEKLKFLASELYVTKKRMEILNSVRLVLYLGWNRTAQIMVGMSVKSGL
jgi:hypothetical protein